MPGQYWPSCIVAGVSATSLLTRSEGFARPVYGLLGLVILSGCVRFWSCSEASLPPPAFGERGHAASRVGASIGPFAPLEGLKARSRRTHANLLQPRPRLLLLPARLKLRLRRFHVATLLVAQILRLVNRPTQMVGKVAGLVNAPICVGGSRSLRRARYAANLA